MPSDFVLRVALKPQSYFVTSRVALVHRPRRLLTAFLLLCFSGIIALIPIHASGVLKTMFELVYVCLMVALISGIYYLRIRLHSSAYGTRLLTFDQSGVSVVRDNANALIEWSAIERVVVRTRGTGFIILLKKSASFLWIPRSAFESEDAVRDWLALTKKMLNIA
jgi:hypothetical protein